MHFQQFLVDGQIFGLAFDWITGNVYVVTWNGFILACDGSLERNFTCVTVLSGLGSVTGLALDPADGYHMFLFRNYV